NKDIHEVDDVFIHAVAETDEGVVVRGAKMVATGSAISNFNFVSYHGALPIRKKEYALSFFAPMNLPNTRLICRPSYEYTAPSAGGSVLPNVEAASAYRILSNQAYPIIKGIIENQTGGALIVHPSSSRDWKEPGLRPLLDQFYRGSNGYSAVEKVKLVKLLW